MARRFVNVTWNNAAVVKKVKPVEPLRYRINPLEKQLDQLDKLEAELERTADSIESELYHELYDSLEGRRERLEARRQRELGNGPVKATPAPRVVTQPRHYHHRRYKRPGLTDFQAKLMGVVVVLTLLALFA